MEFFSTLTITTGDVLGGAIGGLVALGVVYVTVKIEDYRITRGLRGRRKG